MPRTIRKISTTNIDAPRRFLASAHNNTYALFAGGTTSSGSSAVVNSYNDSFTHARADSLTTARPYLVGTNVGTYILFGGGGTAVDAYSESLVHTVPTELSASLSYLGGSKVGNHAIFAGGLNGRNGSAVVNAYDASLTRTIITSLTNAEKSVKGAYTPSYAIFASNYTDNSNVYAYDGSLTKSAVADLSGTYGYKAGESFNDMAIFAGGSITSTGESGCTASADIYSNSLTKSTQTLLSVGRYQLASAKTPNYILFVGGYNGSYSDKVDVLNKSLTSVSVDSATIKLGTARAQLEGENIGDFSFIFAGGYNGSYIEASIDTFEDSWKNIKTSKVMYGDQVVIDLTGDTVTADKMLSGYTAHNADGEVITGTLSSTPGQTYTPGATDITLNSGQIISGDIVLKGDANLLAENIKAGVTIFGVTGTYDEDS